MAFVSGTGLQFVLCSGSCSHCGTTYIQNGSPPPRGQDDNDSNLWLEVLRPFIAVKSLYISRAFRQRITDALQMLVGESVTEVLLALQTLSWMSQAHRDPSRKTLRNLLPHDSLSITLLPVCSGEVTLEVGSISATCFYPTDV